MKFTLAHGDLTKQAKSCFILGITETGELTAASKLLAKTTQASLKKLVQTGDMKAKSGQTWLLPQVTDSTHPILLVGCGKSFTMTERDFRKIVMSCIKALSDTSAVSAVTFLTELTVGKQSTAWKVKHIVEASNAAMYRFDNYKSKKEPASKFNELVIYVADQKNAAVDTALKQGIAIADSVAFTKNLANQPSNICTPNYMANAAKELARSYPKITVKVLEEKELQKLGMGAFMSVTKGSKQDGKLVCLEYKGSAKAPIALVGKGITFDTGGISLKPAESMVGMKYDMCGAATVLGTLRAAAELKLPLHIVGILALAENMPDGGASKPEDIVTTMSGQTVEILNTDAEGRLVLSDALTYCERYKPEVVIDIATLTGAVVVALGHHATGLLANDDKLAVDLLAAGTESHDRAWQLPLWEDYQEQIRSPFADMTNTGGRMGGTITAGCFLSRFAKKFKWAHLDVAGTAAMMGGTDRYATGRPVPLLTQYLINRSASKKK
jgi:leucyl aminopeptidase